MVCAILFSSNNFAQTLDSVVMGNGYADDVFYSFENGEISKIARNNWDIAFYTPRFSAGIMINEGNGVKLFSYPNGDTSDWAAIDTSGMGSWTEMNNMPEYWEEGAFNRNASGHPDYGWGVYNMVDHSVYGDSIFIIQLAPTVYKKLKITKKVSIENLYYFSYADLDGNNEVDVEFDVKPYETKRFAYYSLMNNEGLDREPESNSWDILFTKYMDWTTTLEGDTTSYLVTGVTSNVDIASKNFYPVAPDFSDWFPTSFDSSKNSIGYDWKDIDMSTFQWTVTDSNYYFVQSYSGDVYKLGFTYWSGSFGGGVCHFNKTLISLAAIEDNVTKEEFTIYPNPTTDYISLKTAELQSGMFTLRILDQTGQQIFTAEYSDWELTQGIKLANLKMASGVYIVSLKGNDYAKSQKLIVR